LNEEDIHDKLDEEDPDKFEQWKQSIARNIWNYSGNYDYKNDGALIDGNFIFKNKEEGETFSLEMYD